MVLALYGVDIKPMQAEELDVFDQQKLASQLLIGLLLEKVDEDGLVVLEHTLRREDLHAEKVAYVHNLADDSLTISITFQLRTPIPMPHYDNFFAHRICVDVDKDGNIKQVAAHIACQAELNAPGALDKPGSGGEE